MQDNSIEHDPQAEPEFWEILKTGSLMLLRFVRTIVFFPIIVFELGLRWTKQPEEVVRADKDPSLKQQVFEVFCLFFWPQKLVNNLHEIDIENQRRSLTDSQRSEGESAGKTLGIPQTFALRIPSFFFLTLLVTFAFPPLAAFLGVGFIFSFLPTVYGFLNLGALAIAPAYAFMFLGTGAIVDAPKSDPTPVSEKDEMKRLLVAEQSESENKPVGAPATELVSEIEEMKKPLLVEQQESKRVNPLMDNPNSEEPEHEGALYFNEDWELILEPVPGEYKFLRTTKQSDDTEALFIKKLGTNIISLINASIPQAEIDLLKALLVELSSKKEITYIEIRDILNGCLPKLREQASQSLFMGNIQEIDKKIGVWERKLHSNDQLTSPLRSRVEQSGLKESQFKLEVYFYKAFLKFLENSVDPNKHRRIINAENPMEELIAQHKHNTQIALRKYCNENKLALPDQRHLSKKASLLYTRWAEEWKRVKGIMETPDFFEKTPSEQRELLLKKESKEEKLECPFANESAFNDDFWDLVNGILVDHIGLEVLLEQHRKSVEQEISGIAGRLVEEGTKKEKDRMKEKERNIMGGPLNAAFAFRMKFAFTEFKRFCEGGMSIKQAIIEQTRKKLQEAESLYQKTLEERALTVTGQVQALKDMKDSDKLSAIQEEFANELNSEGIKNCSAKIAPNTFSEIHDFLRAEPKNSVSHQGADYSAMGTVLGQSTQTTSSPTVRPSSTQSSSVETNTTWRPALMPPVKPETPAVGDTVVPGSNTENGVKPD